MNELNIAHPKLWAINHIMCNIAFILLAYLPEVMLSIISCVAIVVYVFFAEVYLQYTEIKAHSAQN